MQIKRIYINNLLLNYNFFNDEYYEFHVFELQDEEIKCRKDQS